MNAVSKPFDFLKQVKVELDKVVWPSKAQTIQLTVMVIMVTIVVGFFIGSLDFLLTELTRLILR